MISVLILDHILTSFWFNLCEVEKDPMVYNEGEKAVDIRGLNKLFWECQTILKQLILWNTKNKITTIFSFSCW